MSARWIIIGGGGHASVVIDTLLQRGEHVLGFVDSDAARDAVLGVAFLGDDSAVEKYADGELSIANGIGSTRNSAARTAIFRRFKESGYSFPPIVHPSAVMARSTSLGAGSQVMAGAVLQPRCELGENVLVNTRASIDHDSSIGAHVHIGPGVTISGDVVLGEGAHVGTGASIIQGVRVGAGSLVAAGSVVLKDVPAGATVMGVPARERRP